MLDWLYWKLRVGRGFGWGCAYLVVHFVVLAISAMWAWFVFLPLKALRQHRDGPCVS